MSNRNRVCVLVKHPFYTNEERTDEESMDQEAPEKEAAEKEADNEEEKKRVYPPKLKHRAKGSKNAVTRDELRRLDAAARLPHRQKVCSFYRVNGVLKIIDSMCCVSYSLLVLQGFGER